MDDRQRDLYERLSRFAIDANDPDFEFDARLARESGWTPEFARRVVAEYKRFVFLCCEAGHPCTPSEHVDQAWHLHLTYTRSYWDRMCGEVLDRPLHHNPTRGGDDEDDKFEDWYVRTKASYERFFGHAPPEDIWPPADERFGRDLRWQRVNLASHWAVPKRPVRLAGAAAMAVAVVSCSPRRPELIPPVVGVAFLWALGLIGAFVAFRCFLGVRRARDRAERTRRVISLLLVCGSAAIGLPALADRMGTPDLGINAEPNSIMSAAAFGMLFLAAIFWQGGLDIGGGGCGGGGITGGGFGGGGGGGGGCGGGGG